jgi:hypothetical protein
MPMLSVRDFGAFGDAHTDDTDAIRRAINAAAFTQPIYFPAGIYLVSSGIDISGQNLVGEPAQSALGWPVPDEASTLYGTVIRVSSESNPLSGGVLFSTRSPPDATSQKKAGKRVHLTSLQVDANHLADFGLQLCGAGNSVLRQVVARNARLDNFSLDDCELANFWLLTSLCAGRHGIHMIDCNGASLQNFYSNHSGAAAGPTSPCSAALPNPEACGLLITNELHSGGVYVEHGDIEGGVGPAIYIKDAVGDGIPTIIEKIWIENDAPTDTVVLDGTRNVIVQNCRIQDRLPAQSLERRAIRLKNGAFSNIIRDNLIGVQGVSLPGTAMIYGDQIELEAGCFNNHLENNLSLRKVPSNWPSAVPVITHDRNHIVGQRQVISHRDGVPTVGAWELGDIVFNARPDQLKVAGWICVRETTTTAPAIWKSFGRFT